MIVPLAFHIISGPSSKISDMIGIPSFCCQGSGAHLLRCLCRADLLSCRTETAIQNWVLMANLLQTSASPVGLTDTYFSFSHGVHKYHCSLGHAVMWKLGQRGTSLIPSPWPDVRLDTLTCGWGSEIIRSWHGQNILFSSTPLFFETDWSRSCLVKQSGENSWHGKSVPVTLIKVW